MVTGAVAGPLAIAVLTVSRGWAPGDGAWQPMPSKAAAIVSAKVRV